MYGVSACTFTVYTSVLSIYLIVDVYVVCVCILV